MDNGSIQPRRFWACMLGQCVYCKPLYRHGSELLTFSLSLWLFVPWNVPARSNGFSSSRYRSESIAYDCRWFLHQTPSITCHHGQFRFRAGDSSVAQSLPCMFKVLGFLITSTFPQPDKKASPTFIIPKPQHTFLKGCTVKSHERLLPMRIYEALWKTRQNSKSFQYLKASQGPVAKYNNQSRSSQSSGSHHPID